MGLLDMEYSLFGKEFWDAWQKFDLASKRFVAQLKREYMEEKENVSSIKKVCEVSPNRDSN